MGELDKLDELNVKLDNRQDAYNRFDVYKLDELKVKFNDMLDELKGPGE